MKPDKQDDASGEAPQRMKRKDYEAELEKLHVELVKLQMWIVAKKLKVCVVFEGRDTAGKGGTIKAITERVSPRVFRVAALPAPTEREKSQMYFQRYMQHLPSGGEFVIFDRSWYNRAGVERVMGFTSEAKVRKFLRATPLVESRDRPVGDHPAEILAGGQRGGADPAVEGSGRPMDASSGSSRRWT